MDAALAQQYQQILKSINESAKWCGSREYNQRSLNHVSKFRHGSVSTLIEKPKTRVCERNWLRLNICKFALSEGLKETFKANSLSPFFSPFSLAYLAP